MPNWGTPNRPSPSVPPMTICSAAVTSSVADGSFMLPVPRRIEAKVLVSQTPTEPENSTLE